MILVNSYIYVNKDSTIVTTKQSISSLLYTFSSPNLLIKSYTPLSKASTFSEGDDYNINMDILYKADTDFITTLSAPHNFNKLMYYDYKYNFDDSNVKCYHTTNSNQEQIIINPIKSYNNMYSDTVNNIKMFYSDDVKSQGNLKSIFDANIYIEPPVYSYHYNILILLNKGYNPSPELDWSITDYEYIFQKVNLKGKIIRFQKEGYKADPIITQNPNLLESLISPEFYKASNFSPVGGILKGISTIYSIHGSKYDLFICPSSEKACLSVECLDSNNCIKADLSKGTHLYYTLLNYKAVDKYLYAFITKKSNDTIISLPSTPIYLPIVNLVPPDKIGYSNFWPYYYDIMEENGTYVPKNYLPVSGGPIEIYKGHDAKGYLNTEKGYIVYRDSIASNFDTTDYNIPNPFMDGDYFVVKGYQQDNKTIVSLSTTDPFSNPSEEIKPITFINSTIPKEQPIYLLNKNGGYFPETRYYSQLITCATRSNCYDKGKGCKGSDCKGCLGFFVGLHKGATITDIIGNNNNTWIFKGSKDMYSLHDSVHTNSYLSPEKSGFLSLSITTSEYNNYELYKIKGGIKGLSLSLSDISVGEFFSIYDKLKGQYLVPSSTTFNCYAEETTKYVSYGTEESSSWMVATVFYKASLKVSSYGYPRYGNKAGIYDITEKAIISNTSTNFSLSIRDYYTNLKGSLIPNFTKEANQVESSFTNYIKDPFFYKSGATKSYSVGNHEKALEVILLKGDSENIFINYGYKASNLYMMGVENIFSSFCTKEGSLYKGGTVAIGFNNIAQNLFPSYSIYHQTYIVGTQSYGIPQNQISNNSQLLNGYDSYLKDFLYIQQIPKAFIANTILPSTLNSTTKLVIKFGTEHFSRAGRGGNMAYIEMNNNLLTVAGGGGGSGIYSIFQTSPPIFNGNNGCALKQKNKENITLNYQLSNMDGGFTGVFKGDQLYKLPSANLGGSVHTFKNNSVLNTYYANPATNQAGGNYGYYPNFSVKGIKSDSNIIRPPVNGRPFISGSLKGQSLIFNGETYIVDSFGLLQKGHGDGGSAKSEIVYKLENYRYWGNKGNIIYYKSPGNFIENYTPAYSQGGGGGGGFGGGSAGSYLFIEKALSYHPHHPHSSLDNVPPGGGGGGNSYVNAENKGTHAYGINPSSVKSSNINVPSILPQILKLAQPQLVDNYNMNEYLKGQQKEYLYLYTGNS